MAPRRGGSSSGLSNSDSDSNPSVWTEKTRLLGSDFHDGYVVAEVAIEAICLFALITIAIWSLTFSKRSKPSRAVFRWFRFGAAMFIGLVAYGFSFISFILEEKSAVVAVVYYLISAIISSLAYVAEIFLLYTVYALLTQLNKRIAPRSLLAKLLLIWIHTIFCVFLFVIYLTILSLSIAYTVESTLHGDYSSGYVNYTYNYTNYYQLARIKSKLNIVYNMLYMVFSVEVLALAIMTLVHSLKTRVANLKNDGISFLMLIAFPLFVRSVFEAAFAAVYGLSDYSNVTQSAAVSETFFYWFCTVTVFAGIVFIGSRLAKDVHETQPGMLAPPATMMSGNVDQYGGNSMPANGYGGHMEWWNKQPQATQQHMPVYNEQNSMQGGGPAPPYVELRDTRPPPPEMHGQGTISEMNGYGNRHEAPPTRY